MSLKKLSRSLLLPGILISAERAGDDRNTVNVCVRERGQRCTDPFNTHLLRKFILLAEDSSQQQARHACSVDNSRLFDKNDQLFHFFYPPDQHLLIILRCIILLF